MLRNFIAVTLFTALAHVSTNAQAQTQGTPEDIECRAPLFEPVREVIQEQFIARAIRVETRLLVDLRDTIVAATCDASKKVVERIESGNIPEGGLTSVDKLPSTMEVAVSVAERVSIGIIEDGYSSRIEALALSATFGINAMLRNDHRKIGFVAVECPASGDDEGFRVSTKAATCDQSLAAYAGSPPVTLYSSGKDICTGDALVKRGQTVVCRCDTASDESRLICR